MNWTADAPVLPIDITSSDGGVLLAILGGIILSLLGVLFLFGWMLYKSATLAQPAPIVASLSMLSVVALIIFGLTSSPEAATLAATGIGAMAGALTSVYSVSKHKVEQQKDDEENPDVT
jgi:hypothetical protein